MTDELAYLDQLDQWLDVVFDAAVDARDKAQTALQEAKVLVAMTDSTPFLRHV